MRGHSPASAKTRAAKTRAALAAARAAALAAGPPPPPEQVCALPVPPSVNRRLLVAIDRRTGKPRLFDTSAYRAYRSDTAPLLARLRPYPADVPVAVSLVWYQVPGVRGDLDNRIKAVLDVLKGAAYADDKQVCSLTVDVARAAGPHGHMAVTVRRAAAWYRGEEATGGTGVG